MPGGRGSSMIARSAHFTFDKKIKYKDLVKVFPDLYKMFLEETNQTPEEEEYARMLIKANMKDLEANRKPEGYNRQGRVRMIFPISKDKHIRFYIYRSSKSEEIGRLANMLSKLLNQKRLKHKIDWDKMVLYALKERKKKE
jgi:hypothetical protein